MGERRLAAEVVIGDLPDRIVDNVKWKDYEDATQHRSAIEEQADCIVTRNKKDFKASIILVLTPEEFFDKIDTK